MSVAASSIDSMHVTKGHSANTTLSPLIKTTWATHRLIWQSCRSVVCYIGFVHVTQISEAYVSSK
jgi:hypothetical protein